MVWRAGWGGRTLAVVWLAQLVLIGPFSYDRNVTQFSAVDWVFRPWAMAVAAWFFSRLCAWRITADSDGLWIPRLLKVEHIPWSDVGEALCRRDGCVAVRDLTFGPFLPPLLARKLRRARTAETLADHLTIMARHPELRPTSSEGTRTCGLPYAAWAPLPLAAFAITYLIAAWRG